MIKKMVGMKKCKFKDYEILAEDNGGVYAFLMKYKGRNVVYKTTDKTLYDDIDGNERRSHAARAFVYEKIKNIYFGGVNSNIVVDAYYECIKDVVMNDPASELFYKSGEQYRSEQSGCITNNKGVVGHEWPSSDELNEHFKLVANG